MTFGFADNDLLLHSDGASCCSASDLYLKNVPTFKANIVAIGKRMRIGDTISLADINRQWHPSHPVSPYLNSTARIKRSNKSASDWPEYIKQMWNGSHGIYKPGFFVGMKMLEERDREGNLQFTRVQTEFDS